MESTIKVTTAKGYRPGDELLRKLMQVETQAWNTVGEDICASSEKIKKRMLKLPNNTLIAYDLSSDDRSVAGSQYCFKLDWNGDPTLLTSWDDLTEKGNIEKVHNPKGNTGFLVGVGVVPEYRNKKYGHTLWFKEKYKVSELLIAFALNKLFEANALQVIANARIPHYHLKPEMNVVDYCNYRKDDGKLFDPVLRFHERMGAKILKPVEFSMEDEESRNGGCWVLYTHAFQP